MNYRIFSGLGVALAAVAVSPLAFATQQTVYLEVGPAYGQLNPYQASDGGEFTAFTTSGVPSGYSSQAEMSYSSSVGGYAPGTEGFETFCVEDSTYFYVNTTYNYTVSNYIWTPSGTVEDGNNSGPPVLVSLNSGVAWLYSQFATGKLAGYDYSNSGGNRNTDAGLLQTAIWELEGLPADPGDPTLDYTNPFINLAISALGGVTAATSSGDLYGVQVMDLYTGPTDDPTGIYQNQLIYTGPPVGVPDGAPTVSLLGASLLALAIWGRRKAKA